MRTTAKMTAKHLATVRRILRRHQGRRGGLVSILQDIQSELGYLPEAALKEVSKAGRRPLIKIYSVATFYSSFRFKPKGKHLLQVCLGTACHVRGGTQVAEQMKEKLGVGPGETTGDGDFTLETVNCLGCCAIGPVVVRDGKYHGQVKVGDLKSLLKRTNSKCGCKK